MRIACPTCTTAYEVPDALLAAGARLLRCARCSTAFPASSPVASVPPDAPAPSVPAPQPEPQPAEVAALPDMLPRPDPAPQPPASPPPASPPPVAELAVPQRDRPQPTRGLAGSSPIDPAGVPARPGQGALAAAWIASFGVIGAGLFALLHWQAEIAAAWPPAARLYAALGLS